MCMHSHPSCYCCISQYPRQFTPFRKSGHVSASQKVFPPLLSGLYFASVGPGCTFLATDVFYSLGKLSLFHVQNSCGISVGTVLTVSIHILVSKASGLFPALCSFCAGLYMHLS